MDDQPLASFIPDKQKSWKSVVIASVPLKPPLVNSLFHGSYSVASPFALVLIMYALV